MAKASAIQKYKITNTTVKPPKIDPKTGEDTRTMLEKVGYAVQFRDTRDTPVPLYPNKSRIVDNVDEGLLKLGRGGMVKIVPVDDVVTALKDHTYQARRPGGEPDPMEDQAREVNVRKAKAVEMGQDGHSNDPVYPDGKPNFEVTAPHNKKGNRRRQLQQASEPEAPVAEATSSQPLGLE